MGGRPLNSALDAVTNRQELLESWGFPHLQRHGITLVKREDAARCLARIYAEDLRILGYDAFVLEGKAIQPFAERDWSSTGRSRPSLAELQAEIEAHPASVTHYEFVFDDDV